MYTDLIPFVYSVNRSLKTVSPNLPGSLDHVKPGPKSNLRERLIASAAHVLTERGLSGLSLREVAGHAGVSANAAYRHFEDREALLAAVAGEGYRELRERFEADLAGNPASGAFETLIRSYFTFAMERTNMHELMTSAELQRDRRHDRNFGEGRRCLELLYEAVRRELPADRSEVEIVREATSAWACVYGLSTLFSRGTLDFLGEGIPTPETLSRLLIGGMRSTPEGEGGSRSSP